MAAPSGTVDGPFAIEALGVEKRYGGTLALKGVDVATRPGMIHALVGENGAGKSTYLGVIAGRVRPSAGSVRIFGEPYELGSPRSAKAIGVSAIYQELTIVPAMSACRNVFLGQFVTGAGLLAERRMVARFRELCAEFGVAIRPGVAAGRLSVADQQTLEIMRGIQSGSRILLFDEPTASLAPPEREALFRVMRRQRDAGVTMMLVSHNLEEVLEISDTVTVFRDGSVVDTAPVADWTKATLVLAMIGHDLKPPAPRPPRPHRAGEPPVVSARGVTLPGAISGIDIDVEAGEIVGIGGLVGSGRSSLLRCLAGLEPHSHGELTIGGYPATWPTTPRRALRHGIALVPEDRKTQGLVLGRSSIDNVVMADYRKVSRLGVLQRGAMVRETRAVAREFGFAERRVGELMRRLSGGNQQKMLLGKWSYRRPRLLLVDEPTRGVDIGAKEEIVLTLRRLADEGLAVVVVSSELEEVVALSDRVLVLSGGRCVTRLHGGQEAITVQAILNAAFQLGGDEHVDDQHAQHR